MNHFNKIRLVSGGLEIMGCYLESCRAREGTWDARIFGALHKAVTAVGMQSLGCMLFCAVALAVLLVVGGVEQNP
jgi:hypothetical protein